jgi:hypothetical protein
MTQPCTPQFERELAARVRNALNDVAYPAHPRTLIECAIQEGAPKDVLDMLRALPDESFGGFDEVWALIVAMRASTERSA